MTAGDYTLTNHGTFSLSSGTLITAVSGVNIAADAFISGGRLHFVSAGEGQVTLLEVTPSAF